MKIFLKNHDFRYAVEQSILALLPEETWEEDENYLISSQLEESAQAIFHWKGEEYQGNCNLTPDNQQFAIKTAVFQAISQTLPYAPPWGSLTGVRPVKLTSKLEQEGNKSSEILENVYFVDKIRSKLAEDCAKISLETQRKSKGNSIYIHIPFCPSPCSYCSFYTTNTIDLLENYLEALKKELSLIKTIPISSLYIGGGTPTILSSTQLADLCQHIRTLFPQIPEFTVEAGRPETITKEKLDVLQSFGVDRISINPQSMKEDVLKKIGRNHSVDEIYQAFSLAENLFSVNMDLIAGISSHEDFIYSLNKLLALSPEQITVHALTPKKNTPLSENYHPELGQKWLETLNSAWISLRNHGYVPYYLYRQKKITQGLENVGWIKREKIENYCHYNIAMMEEFETIIGFGAGAMTKIVKKDRVGKDITRHPNRKDIREYTTTFQEDVLYKKNNILQLVY
ncbi:MAG: coproporphyrinogen dehydrogenase HemZ [Eubacteriales bacterium]